MSIINRSQYNHTDQPPYNNVPKGSIIQGSPLQRDLVNLTFTRSSVFRSTGSSVSGSAKMLNQNLNPDPNQYKSSKDFHF